MKRHGKKPGSQNSLRPTSNRVREALFDILRMEIGDATFLDLYAGTGAVGFEALEEGASEVVFVEESKGSANKIALLAEKRRVAGRIEVVNKRALSFIEWAELQGISYDIIFLDPPYHSDEILQALSAIARASLLSDGGVVIAEHFSKKKLNESFGDLRKIKDYRYGDTILSIFRR